MEFTSCKQAEDFVLHLLPDIASGIKSDIRLNSSKIQSLLQSMVTNLSKMTTNLDVRAIFKLKKRLKEEKLVLVKADKGESLVAIEHAAYLGRVNDFLWNSNAVETKFSIKSYSNSVQETINSIGDKYTEPNILVEKRFL